MSNHRRRRRVTGPQMRGRARALELAGRMGRGLRESRLALGLTQEEVAGEIGVTQAWMSRMERGLGAGASLETWAEAAAAVDERLAAFLERAPGADRPRDYEHLKRQELVVTTAHRGGWRAMPEVPIDLGAGRSRSIDVGLLREATYEAVAVEIWDWFDDVGGAFRSHQDKLRAFASILNGAAGVGGVAGREWRVGGLWVVRGTARNRRLVAEFGALFRSRFPGSSAAWLGALEATGSAMPPEPGLLWTDVAGGRLIAARLTTPGPPASGRAAPSPAAPSPAAPDPTP